MSLYYNWNGDTNFTWCRTVQYTFLLTKSFGWELSVAFSDAVNYHDYTVVAIHEYVSMEHWWNECDSGNQSTGRKTCPSATLSNTNTTLTDMEMNLHYWRWLITCGQMDSNKTLGHLLQPSVVNPPQNDTHTHTNTHLILNVTSC
jgi:hypothetical protein